MSIKIDAFLKKSTNSLARPTVCRNCFHHSGVPAPMQGSGRQGDNGCMPYIDRRTMLCAVAGGVLAAIARAPMVGASPLHWQIPLGPVSPSIVLTRLPGEGNRIALTVDDGASTTVVGAFAQFAQGSGIRLT